MEDLALLRKVSFFQNLTQEELTEVNSIVAALSLKTGQKVFQEGAGSDGFFIVKSGSVMVKSRNIVLTTLGPGQIIGEMSFIDKQPRSATVAVIEESELLKIPADAFEELLDKQPVMAAKVYKSIAAILCGRLRETEGSINERFQPVKH